MRLPFRTAVLAAALVCLTACQPLTDQPAGADGGGTGTGSGQPIAASAAQAASDLKALTVAANGSISGYVRDDFKTWDSQGGGCDTRDIVLKRQGKGVEASSSCKIYQGTWVSPYNDKTYTSPTQLQIDHVVPLGDAWMSGAKSWSASKKEAFANDLTRPQLLAVDSSDNERKGDSDPSVWKPPNHDFWCQYAKNWVTVKAHWHLTVTSAESAALHDMLSTCS
jgi:Protein of unknown function (DUF1524)